MTKKTVARDKPLKKARHNLGKLLVCMMLPGTVVIVQKLTLTVEG